MHFNEFAEHEHFREAWESVKIARTVKYSLFTFGDSDLPYFLICAPGDTESRVSVRKGDVKVTRPLIVRADNAPPDFDDFFEGQEDEAMARFLLARTVQFRNMKFANVIESQQLVSDNVEEMVAKINQKLDDEEDEGVAILTAPAGLGGIAVLRYCLERVTDSAPDNLNELRERGFLPEL